MQVIETTLDAFSSINPGSTPGRLRKGRTVMEKLEKQVEALLDTVREHIEKEGVCPRAYDAFIACFENDCAYCNLVRAYLNIRRPDIAALNTKAGK